MDGDLISRKALLEKTETIYAEVDNVLMTMSVVTRPDIVMAPAVDAEPVRHGRWRHLGGDEWRCTICGEVIHTEGTEKPEDKYCRECGTRMDGEDDK